MSNDGESGVWLNASSLKWLRFPSQKTGVARLAPRIVGCTLGYETVRTALPLPVVEVLHEVYERAQITKGCPDLVLWRDGGQCTRFIEVKCPHWDRVLPHQTQFIVAANAMGMSSEVVEWEFASGGL